MINIELTKDQKLNKINKMLLLVFGFGGSIIILIGAITTSNLLFFNIASIIFLLIILYLGFLQNKELENVLKENGILTNSNKSLLLLIHNKKTLLINGKTCSCHLELTLNSIKIKIIK